MVMSHLPRNGQYELFTFQGKTYCFDDPSFDGPAIIYPPEEMWSWLRSQTECRPMDHSNVAYYLSPKLYLMWKLKWT
jgi:hypothetical protein